MADTPHIPDEAETRAFVRHAELVSASTVVANSGFGCLAKTWTLKQVQGDGGVRG